MPTERWERLEEIFGEAMQRPAAARAEFVAETCGSDGQLAIEVSSLLTAVERSGDFLDVPALDLFAREVAREGWSVRSGERIGAYVIDRRLGSGGMGEVFRARDERLGRDVAIKLLLPHPSNGAEPMRALDREARAAGTLNHINIVTVHDVGQHRGTPYLVTEYLQGEPLRARVARGALPFGLALDVALQIARGLAAAHERGIVHRDLKPENVFVTREGRAKILDFGLAKRADAPVRAPSDRSGAGEAARSLLAGTAGYMAPEQARGEPVDPRADVFALGVITYEMLTGRRPPPADDRGALNFTLRHANLASEDSKVVKDVGEVLRRCLASSPDDRFSGAAELVIALEKLVQSRLLPAPQRRRARLAQRPLPTLGAVILLLAAVALGLRWRKHVQVTRALSDAAPEVQRLMDRGEIAQAFLLARPALDAAPGDPLLTRLWQEVSSPATITTDPPGADVKVAPYEAPAASWLSLGRSPLRDVRIPRSSFRLEIAKSGFSTVEAMGTPIPSLHYRLERAESAPPEMVRVAAGRTPARFGQAFDLGDYWIDKYEVTNRQFKEFVDRGGYERRELWTEPFTLGERTLAWEEARAGFRDVTGRPGPAGWKAGSYPEGEGDFPVTGVSWFEAAAYAAYAGKSLPTLHHWYQAASLGRFVEMLSASNFSGKGAAPVGRYRGLGPFGTYDMAGNVREWAYNGMDRGRFLLGGAWDDGMRMFANSDAKSPFERPPNVGFRLVKYDERPAPAVAASMGKPRRDARELTPVGDVTFELFRRQFAYDRAPLNVDREQTTEADGWRQESVSLDAAYAGERLRAHVFLPEGVAPPYQPVVFFPPSDVFVVRSSRELALAWGEPIVKSGRALIYPVYKGTYERQGAVGNGGMNEMRDLRIAWSRDLGRVVDYLETRADMDLGRLTFYAVRAGSSAVVLTALEPRVKYAVLQGAGIWIWSDVPPEIDAVNYAPRVRVPVMMFSARYDFENPVEPAQRPLFDLLGTPSEHKQHTIVEMGHGVPVADGAKVILPWLDRYLGPARRDSP